jgi:hypothetical protein
MRKRPQKLHLSRETLGHLQEKQLPHVAGGVSEATFCPACGPHYPTGPSACKC